MLIVPVQEMMLWCNMMDMSMDHSQALTGAHSVPMEKGDHCNSSNADLMTIPVEQSSEHCKALVDCNCVTDRSDITNLATITPTPFNLEIQRLASFGNEVVFENTLNETFPPPIWSSSSYSPPDLFVTNESFLI